MTSGKSPRSGEDIATLLKGDRYGGDKVEDRLVQYPPIDERKEYKIPAHLRDQGIGTAKDPDAHLEGDDYLKAKQGRAAHWLKDLDPDKFMEEVRGTEEKPITNNDGKEEEQDAGGRDDHQDQARNAAVEGSS